MLRFSAPGSFFRVARSSSLAPPFGVQRCRGSQSDHFVSSAFPNFFREAKLQQRLPPSVCKGAEDRKATISFPLHQSFQSSICRTKTIVQASVYQKPFGLVGQRGVARHLQSKCLAQSATFKQIYNRLRGCLNQEKRNIIIGLYPQMC